MGIVCISEISTKRVFHMLRISEKENVSHFQLFGDSFRSFVWVLRCSWDGNFSGLILLNLATLVNTLTINTVEQMHV